MFVYLLSNRIFNRRKNIKLIENSDGAPFIMRAEDACLTVKRRRNAFR